MKLAVIGGGNVGATCALEAARAGIPEVVIVDIVEGLAAGKALDLAESAPVNGFLCRLTGTTDYAAISGADVVVVTAGLARKPGMSRDDLVRKNSAITREVAGEIKRHAPESVVIVVTNPLDVMAYVMLKATGFPRRRVIGMAGVLDAARFASFIADELACNVRDVQAMVLGGHGDSMVPLVQYTTVSGIPVDRLLALDAIERLIQRTRGGGGEIVALLKTGSAFYAPGAGAFKMARAVLMNSKRILPASVWAQGEYGLSDVFVGLPVKLGAHGVERIIELELADAESAALARSAGAVKEVMRTLEI